MISVFQGIKNRSFAEFPCQLLRRILRISLEIGVSTHFIVLRHHLLQNDVDLLAYIPMLPNITNFQLATTERVESLLDTVCCAIDL